MYWPLRQLLQTVSLWLFASWYCPSVHSSHAPETSFSPLSHFCTPSQTVISNTVIMMWGNNILFRLKGSLSFRQGCVFCFAVGKKGTHREMCRLIAVLTTTNAQVVNVRCRTQSALVVCSFLCDCQMSGGTTKIEMVGEGVGAERLRVKHK